MKKLEQIPIAVDPQEIRKILRIREEDRVKALLEKVSSLVSGKALYKIAYIEEKAEHSVIIDEIEFNSRVLRKNLDQAGRVFPFIVTLGPELEKEIEKTSNIVDQFYLDAVGNIALGKARKHLEEHIKSTYRIDGLSFMSPGSLRDWPLEEQKPLFYLLENPEASIGVKLTESYLMIPKKSVSGIFFQTDVNFYNCQLCPRKKCPGRKAAFNKDLARAYGIQDDDKLED